MTDNIQEYEEPLLYEAEYGGYQGDFDLFLNLASHGTALDLACGTGRLTIPLAEKGLHVTCLDISEPMLKYVRTRREDLPINWLQGDVCNFSLNQQFDFILMAGNSFQAILSEDDQKRFLACVVKHLKPTGTFVFNTRNPRKEDLKTSDSFEFWHSFKDHTSEEVKVYGKQKYNEADHTVTYTTKRVWQNKEKTTTLKLRFTKKEQLEQLIEQSGLTVDYFYGDDQMREFTNQSPSIITVCKL